MHVCVVGGGAAGWLAAHRLETLAKVDRVTLISSAHIPPIGVGESTTLTFFEYLADTLRLRGPQTLQFLVDIDAAVKYGVSYQNWAPKEFLHVFFGPHQQSLENFWRLGNKPSHRNVNDYTAPAATFAYRNQIDRSFHQPHAFHFDANRFIHAMQALAEPKPGITKLTATVERAVYREGMVNAVVLDDGRSIEADYFVSCIGEQAFNEAVFREQYHSYSDYLLTDKAVVYPLPYTDQPRQFHPFTVARTMKHGWRWITPTWSRIGTGYVFSTGHVSEDEATAEFIADIGDSRIQPFTVNFAPRRVDKVFKQNWCTLGMAGGFLEPLDAPGLTMTLMNLDRLSGLLQRWRQSSAKSREYSDLMDALNTESREEFDTWCSFILCQYRTCHRSDTPFWRDHQAVRFPFHEALMARLFQPDNDPAALLGITPEPNMFLNTVAGKDISWSLSDPTPPQALDSTLVLTADHYLVMQDIRKRLRALASTSAQARSGFSSR